MMWITRRDIHVDRTSCPWLICKFIDSQAEFEFVDTNADAARLQGHTFDMRGAEYGHEGDKCTFQVMLERHDLCTDPALVEMSRIIRDADVPPSRTRRPESGGLDALIRGFQLSVPDDHEKAGPHSARLRCAIRILQGQSRRTAPTPWHAAASAAIHQTAGSTPGGNGLTRVALFMLFGT